MRPSRPRLPVVTTALAWLALGMSHPATAQPPRSEDLGGLRREVFDLRLSLIKAQALREEIDAEAKLVDRKDDDPGPAPGPLTAGDALWEHVFDTPGFQKDGTRKALESFLAALKQDQAEAVARWRDIEGRSWAFRDKVLDLESRLGRSWDDSRGGPVDQTTLQLILLGAATLAASLLLVLHEVRDRWRWRLRALGSRPTLILLALVLAGSGCSGGWPGGAGSGRDEETKALERERSALRDQLEDAGKTNQAAEQRLAQRQTDRRREAEAWLPIPSGARQERLAGQIRQAADDEQRLFRSIRACARVTARVTAEALRSGEGLKKDNERLAGFVSEGLASARLAGLVRGAVCGGFLVAALLPLPLVRVRRRRRRQAEADQCPRCLAEGALTVVASDVQDQRYPEARHAECALCQYQFRETYMRLPRLSIPTVGIRGSGKTHWLVTSYDLIKNGNIPVRSSFKPMPSLEDTRFDQLVRDTLYQRQNTRATVVGLPYPMIFHALDRDPAGRNATLINLFDFSGEVALTSIDQSELRRRSLLFDGFTLFLDPTQLSGQGFKMSIEDQIQALMQFQEEMRVVRDIPPGRKVEVPVAVCVSKLDLLPAENPMADQARDWIGELRSTIAPRVDLATIHRRSRLLARVLPQMFPGWNIERTLRENFGGRFMFFPLTPVGLEEAELGVEDLSHRTLAPFGVLEPILWLLHMHGYCVFR